MTAYLTTGYTERADDETQASSTWLDVDSGDSDDEKGEDGQGDDLFELNKSFESTSRQSLLVNELFN